MPITVPTIQINGNGFKTNTIQFNVGNGRMVEITATYLSPSEATELLKFNTRNRKLRRHVVEKIKSDIKNGQWRFTGETIKIASDELGEFIGDAQHRLVAISEGTVSVPVIIVRNVDAEATGEIDQVRNRGVGDILKMRYGRTVSNDSSVAAIAKMVMVGYQVANYASASRQDIAKFCDANADSLSDWASWAHATSVAAQRVANGRSLVSAMPASAVGALAIYMSDNGGDEELVRDFFNRIANGLVSESDSSNVIPALRKRQQHGNSLSRSVLGGGGSLTSLFSEFAVYVNAYNRWVLNERVESIKGVKHPVTNFSELPKCVSLTR